MKPIKNARLLVPILMILGTVLLIYPNSSIAFTYSGAWVPTSNNYITIDLTLTTGDFSLYMYDWDDPNDYALVIPDGVNSFANISFSKVGNDYNVNISSSNGGPNRSLVLSDNNKFGFFFKSTSTDFFTYNLFNSEGGGYHIQTPDASGSMRVLSLGIAPVPITGAAWMLGTGLIGLVAIRRKRTR